MSPFTLLSLLLFCPMKTTFADWIEYYTNDAGLDNPYFCEDWKKCVPLHRCPEMVSMMDHLSLPVHRFRQTICGYVGMNPKVCCDFSRNWNYSSASTGMQNDKSQQNNVECGASLIRSNVDTLGTYPFVARIGFINVHSGAIKYSCSGAIIDNRHVLTTATCALAKSNDYKLISVLLGDYDSSTDPDCNTFFCGHKARHYNISYIIKHPNFDSNTFKNNIALLRLKSNIDFTVTTQPICISFANNVPQYTGLLIGWGKLSNLRAQPTVQQAWKLTLLPIQECSKLANQGYFVELCATGQVDPCSGYNGSPLVQKHGSIYVLVGLLSYGTICNSQPSSLSVYVDVAKYAVWIEQTVLSNGK